MVQATQNQKGKSRILQQQIKQPEKLTTVAARLINQRQKQTPIPEEYKIRRTSKQEENKVSQNLLLEAVTTSNKITDPVSKINALLSIADAYSQLNENQSAEVTLQQVFQLIQKVKDSSIKVKVLPGIAQVYSKIEDAEIAQKGLNQVLEITTGLEGIDQTTTLIKIAHVYSQIENNDMNEQLLQQVSQQIKTFQKTDEIDASVINIVEANSIIDTYRQFKDPLIIQAGLQEVLQLVKRLEKPRDREILSLQIAAAYLELSQAPKSPDSLKRAEQIVQDSEIPVLKASSLVGIAQAYDQRGDSKAAQLLLQQVLQQINEINFPLHELQLLTGIAEVYGQFGDPQIAREGLQKVIQLAKASEQPWFQSTALAQIAQAYEQLGDTQNAQELLQQVMKSAIDSADPSDQSEAVIRIAKAYGQFRDETLVQKGLQQLMELVSNMTEPTYKVIALQSIAQAYGELDDVTVAQEGLSQIVQRAQRLGDSGHKSRLFDIQEKLKQSIQQIQRAQRLEDSGHKSRLFRNNSVDKSQLLRSVAKAYGQLSDVAIAQQGLLELVQMADNLKDLNQLDTTLSSIAQAYGQLGDAKGAREGLQQLVEQTETENLQPLSGKTFYQVVDHQVSILNDVAFTYSQLEDEEKAQQVLQRLIVLAKDIRFSFSKVRSVASLIDNYGQFQNMQVAQAGLQQAFELTHDFPEQGYKDKILGHIVHAYIQLSLSHADLERGTS